MQYDCWQAAPPQGSSSPFASLFPGGQCMRAPHPHSRFPVPPTYRDPVPAQIRLFCQSRGICSPVSRTPR